MLFLFSCSLPHGWLGVLPWEVLSFQSSKVKAQTTVLLNSPSSYLFSGNFPSVLLGQFLIIKCIVLFFSLCVSEASFHGYFHVCSKYSIRNKKLNIDWFCSLVGIILVFSHCIECFWLNKAEVTYEKHIREREVH